MNSVIGFGKAVRRGLPGPASPCPAGRGEDQRMDGEGREAKPMRTNLFFVLSSLHHTDKWCERFPMLFQLGY